MAKREVECYVWHVTDHILHLNIWEPSRRGKRKYGKFVLWRSDEMSGLHGVGVWNILCCQKGLWSKLHAVLCRATWHFVIIAHREHTLPETSPLRAICLPVSSDFYMKASSCWRYFVKFHIFGISQDAALGELIRTTDRYKIATGMKHETHLSNMRNSSASSSSDFPLLSSFMHLTIMTRNSSKSTVPLPAHTHMHTQWIDFYIIKPPKLRCSPQRPNEHHVSVLTEFKTPYWNLSRPINRFYCKASGQNLNVTNKYLGFRNKLV